jgi:sugar O-acyltransferase (sialic acid O-acetyltransferase NeuD family)
MTHKKIAVIGYSGHAYVIISSLLSQQMPVFAYCDVTEKSQNPFNLVYLGSEKTDEVVGQLHHLDYFVSIGDNFIRRKVQERITKMNHPPVSVKDRTASVQDSVSIGNGVFIAPNSVVNALVVIGDGVVCNSGSIIEHECILGDYSFISPGAVLCGNVTVGQDVFIGANVTIKQGLKIGDGAIIGAGSVVLSDIPSGATVVGNPHRFL